MNRLTLEQQVANLQDGLPGLAEMLPDLLARIDEAGGEGPHGTLLVLQSHAMVLAMLAWYRDHDVFGLRYWSLVVGRLSRVLWQTGPNTFRISQLIFPLLANDERLLSWIAKQEQLYSFNARDRAKPAHHAYLEYQAILSLRQDWERLAERAKRFLAHIPKATKKFAPDERFFAALALGNETQAESAIHELTLPQVARFRNVDVVCPFFTSQFSTHAVMYIKIARRVGLNTCVESPLVPKEWLTMVRVAGKLPYDFLERFDVERTL